MSEVPGRSRFLTHQGQWLARKFRLLTGDRRGASLIIFGLSLPILIGFIGLSVEVAFWYLEKRELQEAVDSAALAGAYEILLDETANQARLDLAAGAAVDLSGFTNPTTITVNHPPLSGFFIGDDSAVEAYVTETYGTHFAAIVGVQSVNVQTRAVAKLHGGGGATTACILSLHDCFSHPSEGPGIILQGSLDLQAPGCSLHSNDTCQGIDMPGNPTINAECITAEGDGLTDDGVSLEEGSRNMTLSSCSVPQILYNGPEDPYENVDMSDLDPLPDCGTGGLAPSGAGTDTRVTTEGIYDADGNLTGTQDVVTQRTFTPGRYCGADIMQVINNGVVTELSTGDAIMSENLLEPGLYLLESDILINTSAFKCNGPCIIAQPAQNDFDFRGIGELLIRAPTDVEIADNNTPGATGDGSGDTILDNAFGLLSNDADATYWAGLAIYNSSTDALGEHSNCPNKLNGNGVMDIFGALYFPDTCIVFNGNASTEVGTCFQVIGGNVTLGGNFSLGVDGCPESFPTATYPPIVGLVE